MSTEKTIKIQGEQEESTVAPSVVITAASRSWGIEFLGKRKRVKK